MELGNIVVISQEQCRYCFLLKELLEGENMEYLTIMLDKTSKSMLLREFMKGMDINTVPAVFVDGTYVGGYTQMLDLLGKGK
jgi:glutaredoxin